MDTKFGVLSCLFIFHCLCTEVGGFDSTLYVDIPKNTAAVAGHPATIRCTAKLVQDFNIEWKEYSTTENGVRIALNGASEFESLYFVKQVTTWSYDLTILSTDESDIVRHVCRLITSNAWSYFYIVLLETRPQCGPVDDPLGTGRVDLTVNEHDVLDLRCNITYDGLFQPTLAWEPSAKADVNATSLGENRTLTEDIQMIATEELNNQEVTCRVFFENENRVDSPEAFPPDTNNTHHTKIAPEFQDTCIISLNVLYDPRDIKVYFYDELINDTTVTLYIGESLTVSARANPPAKFTWIPKAESSYMNDTEGPQLNATREMVGWNYYEIYIYNDYARMPGFVKYNMTIFVAPIPTTGPDEWTTDVSLASTEAVTIDDCIDLSCDLNTMHVTLDIVCFSWLFPDLDPTSLTLEDPNCIGQQSGNDTLLEWSTYFGDCLTRKRERQNSLEFTNMLIDFELDESGTIIIDYNWKMNLSCIMQRNLTLSRELDVTMQKKTDFYLEERMNFNITLELFEDSNFTMELVDNPLVVELGQELFVQVRVVNPDPRLKIVLYDFVASANPVPLSGPEYSVIVNRCPKMASAAVFPSSNDTGRASFRVFKFVAGGSEVYLGANVVICTVDEESSRCSRECVNAKRSRRDITSRSYVRIVAKGPIVLRPSDANIITNELRSGSSKSLDQSPSAVTTWTICLLVSVAVLLVALGYGVASFQRIRRNSKT